MLISQVNSIFSMFCYRNRTTLLQFILLYESLAVQKLTVHNDSIVLNAFLSIIDCCLDVYRHTCRWISINEAILNHYSYIILCFHNKINYGFCLFLLASLDSYLFHAAIYRIYSFIGVWQGHVVTAHSELGSCLIIE